MIWCSEWYQPYTPGLLVKWVSFLNSLLWPIGDLDLGVGYFLCGVAYLV